MCYKIVNVDYTRKDDAGDPLVRLLFNIEFPTQVLAELMVEKLYKDAEDPSSPAAEAAGDLFEFPIGLINVHDGDITVFSDQEPLPGASWETDDVFRAGKAEADHVVRRGDQATTLMAEGISPDALWAALGRFLIVNHPEVLGIDPEAPERLEALAEAEQARSKQDKLIDQLEERFGDDPSKLSEGEMLEAIEFALGQLQGPDGVDPFGDTDTDTDTNPESAPAPKGLKIRGE